MDGATLSNLMTLRRTILGQLLEAGKRQIDVIESGRMSELMNLLGEKQTPLNQLAQISHRLREVADEDPELRVWESEEARQQCRRDQEECEQLHIELLAIEAQCETALSQSREALSQEIQRVDSAYQAASSYSQTGTTPVAGNQLDLSSD